MASQFLFFAFLAVTSSIALASDPSSLQDFCVADATSSVSYDHLFVYFSYTGIFPIMVSVLVNGRVCKDPKLVEANDFFFSGLHLAGNTSSAVGLRMTSVGVAQIGGLNALGISVARIDFGPWGLNSPHTHPRASEILTVLEGSLKVGFVTSNTDNRLITKVLQKGDVFVFPVGLVHFQQNVGHGNALAVVALSSQNPGVITIANAVFGSKPDIPADILAKAFQVDTHAIYSLQSKF